MISTATPKPAIDRGARRVSTWALCTLVTSGRVDGGAPTPPLSGASTVVDGLDVVDTEGAAVPGVRTEGVVRAGLRATGVGTAGDRGGVAGVIVTGATVDAEVAVGGGDSPVCGGEVGGGAGFTGGAVGGEPTVVAGPAAPAGPATASGRAAAAAAKGTVHAHRKLRTHPV